MSRNAGDHPDVTGEARALTAALLSPDGAVIGQYGCVAARASVAAFVVVALVSCGGSAPKVSSRTASSTTGALTTTNTTAKPLRVGDTAGTPITETLVLYFDHATSARDHEPNAALAEVRLCNTAKQSRPVRVQPPSFTLTLLNGAIVTNAREAEQLVATTLTPSQCKDRSMIWHLAGDEHARAITDTQTHTTWSVPCAPGPSACGFPKPTLAPDPSPGA